MTPLVLLTGFLGAGKTSLLRRVLPEWKAAGVRSHVILNDQANAEVDSLALRELVEEVHALTAGCICCDSREALADTLETLEVGADDLVLLETSGTTDPLPLIEFLLVAPPCRRFNPLLQVALVDTQRWQRRGHLNALEHQQVRTATHVVFTWQDTVSAARVREVRQAVQGLNPIARVLESADLPQALLAEVRSPAGRRHPAFVPWVPPKLQDKNLAPGKSMPAALTGSSSTPAPLGGVPKSIAASGRFLPGHSAHRHAAEPGNVHDWSHRFVALQLEVPRRLGRPRLLRWLEELPPAVIRAKGIVEFADQPDQFHLFQRVEDTTHFTEIFVLPPGGVTLALLVGIGFDAEQLRRAAEHQFNQVNSHPKSHTYQP